MASLLPEMHRREDIWYQHKVTPEQRLIGAMIERAILDATGRFRVSMDNNTRVQKDAQKWIFNWREVDDNPVGTFGWACEVIGADPKILQAIIRQAVSDGYVFLYAKNLAILTCIKPLEF